MKVLLLSPNMESLPDPVFPIGLAYISGALEKNGIPHRILDLCFAEDFENAVQSAVTDFNPDFVAVSIRNIDNVAYPNYISYIPFYKKVIECIRRNSRAFIILGGSGFSLIPSPLMEYLGADYGIVGEGEHSFVSLINRLDGNKNSDPPLESGIIDDSPNMIGKLDELPIPERAGFDPMAYFNKGGMGNIQTKRGCPFHCVYCTYPVIEGNRIRLRNPVQVCNEIEHLIQTGITHLFFVDNTFNYPMEHASAICTEIVRRGLQINWGCYANPKFISPEFVDLLKEAGCSGLEFGCDAANDGMLFRMGKNFNVRDIGKASAFCRNSGLPFCHSLLLGGPGETLETVRETVQRVIHMRPTAAICMVGIRVFPNTRLSSIAEREGIVGPDEDFLRPVFYLSPAIEHEILPFIENFAKENPSWIFPGLNINIDTVLQKKLRRFGIKGPLWEQMGRVRRK